MLSRFWTEIVVQKINPEFIKIRNVILLVLKKKSFFSIHNSFSKRMEKIPEHFVETV